MGELVLVGLGLYDEKDISLSGLEEARTADTVFMEAYTSLMAGLRIEKLEDLVGLEIRSVSREMLEEENGEEILAASVKGKTVFLVPGDPLIATTHVNLRINARSRGVKTRVVHGASIISAAIGLSGLQNYKFGRSVSIPYTDVGTVLETPYTVIKVNLHSGLHTLCFLDIVAEKEKYMTIEEGLEILLEIGKKMKDPTITEDTLVVGIARAGSRNPIVRAHFLERMRKHDFKGPPHTLIFPARLHFVEAEALVKLANAPESIRELVK